MNGRREDLEVNAVSEEEAARSFGELLKRVREGEEIIITATGLPIAVLKPAEFVEEDVREAALEELKGFGRGRSLGGITIRELIEEGRRY